MNAPGVYSKQYGISRKKFHYFNKYFRFTGELCIDVVSYMSKQLEASMIGVSELDDRKYNILSIDFACKHVIDIIFRLDS